MGLKTYRKKRSFSKTTEPRGGQKQAYAPDLFVIHKHAAHRLHYDLRLEMNGVLKSWAVPKGPSLVPLEKRLAVNVEDHPLEYVDFEGNIPGGEYGAGDMIVWDRGKWESLEEDPLKAYKNGKIKFALHGKKLKGKWSLIRMKKDEKNWLLFKERDEYSGDVNILEKDPGSVLSGLKVGDIDLAISKEKLHRRKKLPDPSKLPFSIQADMPQELRPELASLLETPPSGDAWLYEMKYDGYRIICFIDHGKVRLFTRNGYDWTAKFKTIAEYCRKLPIESGILDGELTVPDEKGISSFQLLQNAIESQVEEKMRYFIFDIPYYNGYSLKKTPLFERKKLLKEILELSVSGHITYSEHLTGAGKDVLESACRLGLEGIMAKAQDSSYEERRTRSWIKVKCLKRQEFVIGGFTPGKGSRSYFGALLLGYYQGKNLIYSGKVGTGFDMRTLKSLSEKFKTLEVPNSPFFNLKNPEESAYWIKPKLVAEISFMNWTEDSLLRHASFIGLREDKNPKDVTLDLPESSGKIMNLPKKGNEKSIEGISITHPDKVFFSGPKITKLDLAKYYEMIADRMLPHIAGRPLVLVRCPEGSQNQCFFQKHPLESLPATIKSFRFQKKDSAKNYIYIDDRKSLISLVQYGVIEFHIMDTLVGNMEKPDRMVFDFDPAPDVKPEAVTAAALHFRQILLEYGLESFVKTTGGKGLHLVVPIERTLSWQKVKDISRILAELFVEKWPDYLTATMSKSVRKGKIFIDFFRNNIGATWAAPYTVRARPNAPVSLPLQWDDLTSDLRFDQFTLLNADEWMAKIKKDPWENISAIKQEIPGSLIRMLKK